MHALIPRDHQHQNNNKHGTAPTTRATRLTARPSTSASPVFLVPWCSVQQGEVQGDGATGQPTSLGGCSGSGSGWLADMVASRTESSRLL